MRIVLKDETAELEISQNLDGAYYISCCDGTTDVSICSFKLAELIHYLSVPQKETTNE